MLLEYYVHEKLYEFEQERLRKLQIPYSPKKDRQVSIRVEMNGNWSRALLRLFRRKIKQR